MSKPFNSTDEYYAWHERNCEKCRRYCDNLQTPDCAIDEALFEAVFFGGGIIDDSIAQMMGDGEKCKQFGEMEATT
jgi:hypothetical protein